LEQRVYALQDANWNTTAIVAAAGVTGVTGGTGGTVINRFAYTPYGESQTLTASWATPVAGTTPATPWAHLFQGLEFTAMTGLAYVRHRDYSASLGRFIELDPIGFNAGDNNWYRFVGNGPTGKVDPSGLIPLDTIWDVGNIIYDIAIGDHVSLAADVAALAVPYVPAGSTKLVAAAKVADVVGWNSSLVRSLKVEYKYIGIADNFPKHTLPASAASKTWMTMTKGNPSKFIPGWGDKEIKGLIQEAFDEAKKKGLVKPEQLNGYVYDAKRTIGASDGCPAKRVEIKINKNGTNLHAFPVR
jgi:RHS repeat-associated protein